MNQVTGVLDQVLNLSVDLLIIAAATVVLFFLVFTKGKKLFITAALAFYPAVVLYQLFPYLGMVTGEGSTASAEYFLRLAVFVVFGLLSFLAIKYFIRRHIETSGGKKGLQALVLSLTLVVQLLALSVVLIPIKGVYPLSPLLTQFLNETTVFWWLAAPLAALYFALRKH